MKEGDELEYAITQIDTQNWEIKLSSSGDMNEREFYLALEGLVNSYLYEENYLNDFEDDLH
jgi:hypothetical protein